MIEQRHILALAAIPKNIPDTLGQALDDAASEWEINTDQRAQMFLAQLAHESGGFTAYEENLNYSADRLLTVFPKYFTGANVSDYSRQPRKIASRVYASRMGNGDEASGDGWNYRGRGLIQLTGLTNYRQASIGLATDFVIAPDLVEVPDMAALVAAWFWSTRGCNELADADDFTGITKRINGGLNGLNDRLAKLEIIQRNWA
jgi:putative chitinase